MPGTGMDADRRHGEGTGPGRRRRVWEQAGACRRSSHYRSSCWCEELAGGRRVLRGVMDFRVGNAGWIWVGLGIGLDTITSEKQPRFVRVRPSLLHSPRTGSRTVVNCRRA